MAEMRIATTPEEKEAVYRLRYDVYVEEMGRYRGGADHEHRRLADPEDESSWLFYAVEDGEVIATMRITWGGSGFSERQIRQYELAAFLAEIPAERMSVGERAMVVPRLRGTDLLWELGEFSNTVSESHDVRVVFGACEPHLVSFYCRFQRPYAARNLNTAEAGYLVPLIGLPKGPESVLGIGHGDGMPRCIEQALSSTGAVRTPMLEDPDAYVADVTADLAAVGATVFDGFTEDELARCLAKSNVITCAEGDRLLKQGGAARNVFVLLSGALEVSADGHPVGVVLPGEVVGEIAFLLEQPRSFDVDVLTDDTRLLSLSERTLRCLTTNEPTIAAKLLGNISKVLCRRLAPAAAAR